MKFFLSLSFTIGTSLLLANPEGFRAVMGEASYAFPNEQTLEVTTGHEAILEWHSFSIGTQETTRFIMPSKHSRVLNRVMGGNLSEILGTLESNGEVYLINPNGILVGEGAYVNTASFIASSFDILNEDFLQGNANFCWAQGSSVINLGTISASDGAVQLIGDRVVHGGSIEALSTENRNGKTFLVGGNVFLLGDEVVIHEMASICASGDFGGGTVLIGGDYQGANPQIRNASKVAIGLKAHIEANAFIEGDGGRVIVWANESNTFFGNIFVCGGLNHGNGGFAEVSSTGYLAYHGLTNALAHHGKKGTLLLDPGNITISTDPDSSNIGFGVGSCGSFETYCSTDGMDANLNNITLATQLLFTDVIVSAINDITVTASIIGPSALTLQAGGDINVLGGSSVATLIAISTSTLTLSAGGNITLQGGSNLATFVSLDSAMTSLTGNYIYLLGGTGVSSFVNVTSDSDDLTLFAVNDIVMTGSDMSTSSGVSLNTSVGTLNLDADGGNIFLTAGAQTGSGITLNAGEFCSITANDNFNLTSTSLSASTIYSFSDTTINVLNMNLTATSNAQPSSIVSNGGDFTLNANDLNLNAFSNITISGSSLGDFIIALQGNLLITGNSMLENQGSGTTTMITANELVTLDGTGGGATISNNTSAFTLSSGSDLVISSTVDGVANISTMSPSTVINVSGALQMSGNPSSMNSASIITNDGSLSITTGSDANISSYSIIEITFDVESLSITSNGNLNISDFVVIGHLGTGAVDFNITGNATITSGPDGFVNIFSPTTLNFTAGGPIAISSTSGGPTSITSNSDFNMSGFSIDTTGYDDISNLVTLSSEEGAMLFTTTDYIHVNQNTQISLFGGNGNAVFMSGSDFLIADNSFIESFSTGDLDFNVGGFTTMDATAGFALIQSFNGDVNVVSGDDITITASMNGTAQVMANTGISLSSSGNIIITGNASNAAVIENFDGNVTISAGNDLTLQTNTNISITTGTSPMTMEASTGDISLLSSFITQSDGDLIFIAGTDITFDPNAIAGTQGNVLLIVDNNNPTSPDIGPGAFNYPNGASIGAGFGMYMRIYTALQSQNTIGSSANINGLTYVAQPEFDDDDQEFWGVYYPTVPAPTPSAPYPDGTDFFTIYYKNSP